MLNKKRHPCILLEVLTKFIVSYISIHYHQIWPSQISY